MIKEFEITLPIRTVSEANSSQHWRFKNARKKAQQQEVRVEMQNRLRGQKIALPCRVTLTRVGCHALDKDNLANSFKGIQDEVARVLGVDDGDESKVSWFYEQHVIGRRQYSVKIAITSQPRGLPL